MAVHTQVGKVKVLQMVVQARYDEGYRYLDRSGELLTYITSESEKWIIAGIGPDVANLRHLDQPLAANVGVKAVDVSIPEQKSMDEAAKILKPLADESEWLYGAFREKIKVGQTTRLGVRFQFLAPTDSLEVTDRQVVKEMRSAYTNQVQQVLKMELVDGTLHQIYEDPESGVRRVVRTASTILDPRTAVRPAYGFKEDTELSGGLLVDIDTYTRPPSDQIAKLSNFVQQEYTRCSEAALELMKWIVSPR